MNGDFEARRPKVESRRSVGPKSNQVASAGKWDVGRRPLCPRLGHLFFAGQKTLIFGRFFGVAAAVNQVASGENVARRPAVEWPNEMFQSETRHIRPSEYSNELCADPLVNTIKLSTRKEEREKGLSKRARGLRHNGQRFPAAGRPIVARNYFCTGQEGGGGGWPGDSNSRSSIDRGPYHF